MMSIVNTDQMDELLDQELPASEQDFLTDVDPDEERRFISELDDEFDPDAAVAQAGEPAPPTKAEAIAALQDDAALLVGGAECLLQSAVHPELALSNYHQQALAKAAAPLLYKYGGELPPWLKPYKEELGFALALASAGGSMYLQYRRIQKLEAENAAGHADKGENDATTQPE